MIYSMPVKSWAITPGHRITSDGDYRGIKKKDVIVQIEHNNHSIETYEFNTSEECAEFLGLTVEEVQIIGDENLILKRKNQKIRIVCEDISIVKKKMQSKEKKEKKELHNNLKYKSQEGIVWVELKEPIFGYTHINNLGELRKRNESGNLQKKVWLNVDGVPVYQFVNPKKREELIKIEVEPIFKEYIRDFDEAFRKD